MDRDERASHENKNENGVMYMLEILWSMTKKYLLLVKHTPRCTYLQKNTNVIVKYEEKTTFRSL